MAKVKTTTAKTKTKKIDKPVESNEIQESKEITITKTAVKDEHEDLVIIHKLQALYRLQQIDSQITKIRSVRGMLPVEIKDLEDTIAGLETRIANMNEDIKTTEQNISAKNISIKDCMSLIKKYESYKENVKNNREYESLANQILNQELDIKLHEKDIRNFKEKFETKKRSRDSVVNDLEGYKKELEVKVNELDEIIAETTKEEKQLEGKALECQKFIDERLLTAYNRIRKNAKNGLAVVTIERDACGGCYNKIPPQRQLDIRTQKKVIVCEYCGRILVDQEYFNKEKV